MNIKLPKINLSLQLLGVFCFAFFFGNDLPLAKKAIFYAGSLSFKELLIFFLPFIIFTCIFHSLVTNQGKAFRFVSVILIAVCLSNFISILASYGFGLITLPQIGGLSLQTQILTDSLVPAWSFSLPKLIPNEVALFAGLVLGLIFSFLPYKTPIIIGEKANKLVTFLLQKLIVPILPLFALGYILKIQHEGILNKIVESYGPIILLVVIVNIVYLLLMFFMAAQFNVKNFLNYLKNVIPVGILGFTTMSSMATMPATLNAAEKNTDNPELSRAIVPATVNIHMIGDSLVVPILAMAILLTFGQSLPTFSQYLIFTYFFMLIKFAVPGIPGGTMLVLLPTLEKCFGFTPEMSAFIAAIYILFDPIITAGNVLGNSALTISLTRILGVSPAAASQKPLPETL